MRELSVKLGAIRRSMARHGLGGVRLRGTDWFSWATCGGSSAVLLTSDVGVAEVWVTGAGAWVLTDEIERARLQEEELPPGFGLWAGPWADPGAREAFVEADTDGPIASDRPVGAERPLPDELVAARSALLPEEVERYRALGRDAAEAVTEVLLEARPDWTGHELAGAAARALWARGVHPALTLVGDERRLPEHRHPTPSADRLGSRAMLVCCGRRHGLFANLTRFVYFRPPTAQERQLAGDVAQVEAAAFAATRPGAALRDVYARIAERYRELDHPGGERHHHQGGASGYLSRTALARPDTTACFQEHDAAAWNPSLPGAKIEDTVLVSRDNLEVLTVDPRWPTIEVDGRLRPDLLVR